MTLLFEAIFFEFPLVSVVKDFLFCCEIFVDQTFLRPQYRLKDIETEDAVLSYNSIKFEPHGMKRMVA